MKKAFVRPARHKAPIAAAYQKSVDQNASVAERNRATEEWRYLVLRRRGEISCVWLARIARHGLLVAVLIVAIGVRPSLEAMRSGDFTDLWVSLAIGAAGGLASGAAKHALDRFRASLAERYPVVDDR